MESGDEKLQTLKQMLRRTEEIATSYNARVVTAKHFINFNQCYPWDLLAGSPIEAVRKFVMYQKDRLSSLLGR